MFFDVPHSRSVPKSSLTGPDWLILTLNEPMNMNRIIRVLLAAMSFIAVVIISPVVAADELPSGLKATVRSLLPNIAWDAITQSPIPNLYRITHGGNFFYISADGRFIIRGDLFDLQADVNLTEKARRIARLKTVNALGGSSMIVFPAKDHKHTVTVFTDVDCPYCAKFHNQMDAYNARGITVRYAAFPRTGAGSDSYVKTVSVWCSDDPHTAIGIAKAGQAVEPRTCPNPVREHFQAGIAIGVRGTPTMMLDTGGIITGYVPPQELAKRLDEHNN